MKDRLTTAPQPMERPQGSCGTWNARRATGTASWPLEQPQGFWNARSAIGTRLGASGTPVGLLERALAPLERPQGYFVLFVGRRYYLRPNPLRSPPLRPLERAQATGTRLGASGTARRGLVKSHYYTRATHGIVEVMWSNRGAFVERNFAIVVLKCRMRVQNYYFFLTWQWVVPDCVRFWSGLRAISLWLPRLPRLPRLPHVCFFLKIVVYIGF